MESSNPESRPRLYIIVLFQDMRYVDIIHVYINIIFIGTFWTAQKHWIPTLFLVKNITLILD